MEENIEKTKVCTIFEPTFRSIMLLPENETQLKMFVSLCEYAFDVKEPEFGDKPEDKMLEALWTQFKVVFVQAKKRAKRNAINGRKGGRPRMIPNESDGFGSENPKNPTNTSSYTAVGSSSSSHSIHQYSADEFEEADGLDEDDEFEPKS